MIDFHLLLSKPGIDHTDKDSSTLQFNAEHYALTICNTNADNPIFHEDENSVKIWVGGYLICNGFDQTWDQFKMESIVDKTKIDNIFRKLNGIFGLIWIDKKKQSIYLITDHLGFFPVYYYKSDLEIICTNALTRLVANRQLDLRWNQIGIKEYILNGHFLANECWYEEVTRMSAATILEFDIRSHSSSQFYYWTWERIKKIPGKLEDLMEGYDQLFQKSIREVILPKGKAGISLSGGLDSRYIANSTSTNRDIEGFTFSQKGSNDLKIAKRVCDILHLPHRQLLLPRAGLFKDRFSTFVQGDGMLHLGHLHECEVHQELEQTYDFYFHGFFGGGIYGLAKDCNTRIDGKCAERHFCSDRMNVNLSSPFYDTLSIDPFIIDQRIRNQSAFSIKILSNYSKIILPFYNMNWMEYNYSVPDEYQLNMVFYLNVLNKKLDKGLTEVPWQKTGIPIEYLTLNSLALRLKIPSIREKLYNSFQKSTHFIKPLRLTLDDLTLIDTLEEELPWIKGITMANRYQVLVRKLSVGVWFAYSNSIRGNAT